MILLIFFTVSEDNIKDTWIDGFIDVRERNTDQWILR